MGFPAKIKGFEAISARELWVIRLATSRGSGIFLLTTFKNVTVVFDLGEFRGYPIQKHPSLPWAFFFSNSIFLRPSLGLWGPSACRPAGRWLILSGTLAQEHSSIRVSAGGICHFRACRWRAAMKGQVTGVWASQEPAKHGEDQRPETQGQTEEQGGTS